jgi:hypothetical protein
VQHEQNGVSVILKPEDMVGMALRVGSLGRDIKAWAILAAPATPVSKLSIKPTAQQGRGKVITMDGYMRRVQGRQLVRDAEAIAQ